MLVTIRPCDSPYVWADWMGQILPGIPVKLDRWCQQMVVAGLEYLKKHPQCAPKMIDYTECFCWLTLNNDDARDLWWHMRDTVTEGKHARWTLDTRSAALRTVLAINDGGWDWYVKEKCLHPAFVDDKCLYCKKEFNGKEDGAGVLVRSEDGARIGAAQPSGVPAPGNPGEGVPRGGTPGKTSAVL